MHKDASNIFNLYLEAVEEQPQIMQQANGAKLWYLHGKLHRVDGPAVEWRHGYRAWLLHGKLHREDGPATESENGNKEWYLHGKQFANAGQWAEAVLKMHNKPHDAAAVDAFLRPILRKDIEASL